MVKLPSVPVIEWSRPTPHSLYVLRLYRRSLKLAQDWYWQRTEFREKALLIREQFERSRHEENPRMREHLVADSERMLAQCYHHQPYICKVREKDICLKLRE